MVEVSEFRFDGSAYVQRLTPGQDSQIGRARSVRGTKLTHERPGMMKPAEAPTDMRRSGHGVLEVLGVSAVADATEADIK